MMAPRKKRGQILILLATWLFFGGGASSALIVYDLPISEVKKAVKHVITDGSRKNAILSDISRWEAVQEIRDEAVNKSREELLKRLRRKATQRAELEPIMTKLDTSFLVMDLGFLDLRFRVKEQVTNDEWAEIVARP